MNLRKSETYKTFINGVWGDHPVFSMVLGICSSLAISNRVENALAMGGGVTFVLIATAVLIAPLRKIIPMRVRMITFMIIIAAFVIIVDKFLKAYVPPISRQLGPYVGLIITNCILMGRAEAFYIQNGTGLSIVDAVANGIGYTYTLVIMAAVREVLGFGTFLGFRVMPHWWTNWVIISMAPGAFFLLSVLIWLSRTITKKEPQ